MAAHQCAQFCNNLHLVHERAIRRIANYLASKYTYVDLPDENWWLSTYSVVYSPDKEKVVDWNVDADFSGGWDKSDSDNAENTMLCAGYLFAYTGCPVLCCSKLQMEIAFSTIEAEYIALI